FALMSSFLRLRHHPTPTLFPYTTLFRSETDVDHHAHQQCGTDLVFGELPYLRPDVVPSPAQPGFDDAGGNHRIQHRRSDGLQRRDRKSTRLNSSHRTISYAVFCLKKKNS